MPRAARERTKRADSCRLSCPCVFLPPLSSFLFSSFLAIFLGRKLLDRLHSDKKGRGYVSLRICAKKKKNRRVFLSAAGGRWTWAFSYFIFGVVIAHAKKTRKKKKDILTSPASLRPTATEDQAIFFYLTIDSKENFVHRRCSAER